jgi:putative colanic acid biosynthesis glycosyltransferase WcaI
MRVVVWGINYAPEITGIAPHNVALCEFLQRSGHEVEMVTTFPYYPAWRKRSEDRYQLFRTDRINGLPVHRCWHFVPKRVTPMKRIVHEASFIGTSIPRILGLRRADVYVIVSPPLVLGVAAWFVAKLKRAPFVFHVQDLQPDAAVGLGMLRPGVFTRLLYFLEAFAYKHAARVSGISEEILQAFRRKNVPKEKMILFPNAVLLPKEQEIPPPGRFRAKHGFSSDEFLAVYAGNLGVKQGLHLLLDAAQLLGPGKNIRIVIAGDGAARESLEQEVCSRSLANVSLLPLQYGMDYKELLVDTDLSLITQQSGSGNAFFPSKLLIILAFSGAVLTVADEESALARVVAEGRFGRNVAPGDPKKFAATLLALSQSRQELREWGSAGRTYVERFEQGRVLAEFTAELKGLASR